MQTPYRRTAKKPPELVVVASYDSVHEAELARGYLEAEEIEVELSGEGLVNLSPLNSSAAGDIKLMVDVEDELEAKDLLADYRARENRRRKRRKESADDVARRAFRAALLGLFVFPVGLHVYSLWLLMTQLSGKLTRSGRRNALWAHVIDWLVVAAFFFYVLLD